jgi:hypothetical protein
MRMANDKTSPAPRHDVLEEAFDRLERAVPDRVTRAIRWMRKPQARLVRVPLGLLCILGGFLWFMPALGLWLLPLGLMLVAQDVRFLRRPVGKMTLWLLDRWAQLQNWWRTRRSAARSAKKTRTT